MIGREYILPDLDVPPSINPRPDTKHILATPDTQNSPTDLLARLRELITHNSKQEILPVSIRHPFL